MQFEAQRPIDTLTTKHTLHFSHFSRTESQANGNSSSTLAHFSFVPIERSEVRSHSQDSTYTTTTSSSDHPGSPDVAERRGHYFNLHANDQGRLVQRSVTSSVAALPLQPDTSSSRRGEQQQQQRFTDVSSPMHWRETSSTPTQLVHDDGPASVSVSQAGNRARGSGYEGFNDAPPNLSGHWSEPIASSSAAYDSDLYDSSEDLATREANKRARQQRKPTYRFQLDPLDSFETWILSLTLQRKSDTLSTTPIRGLGSTRPLRWEKRVAEGLDRVFRDWFSIHNGSGIGGDLARSYGDSALHRASLIATGPSSQSMPGNTSIGYTSLGKQVSRDDAEEEEQPEPKTLEFDGASCTMIIQPHAADSSHPMHPALTSMPSHHYLSNSSQSFHWHNSLTSRVEYTFHCESLTVNAARLLNVLEDVEKDVERASDQAKRRGAQIVAGSSGGTSWAYSTGGSNFASSGNGTSVFSGGNRTEPGAVSVIVFGAVRD